jgi:hypothetical protein
MDISCEDTELAFLPHDARNHSIPWKIPQPRTYRKICDEAIFVSNKYELPVSRADGAFLVNEMHHYDL